MRRRERGRAKRGAMTIMLPERRRQGEDSKMEKGKKGRKTSE